MGAICNFINRKAEYWQQLAAEKVAENQFAVVVSQYYNVGLQLFEALQSVSSSYVFAPSDISAVLVSISRAQPYFVYHVDVVNGQSAAALQQIRRELARVSGLSLQQLVSMYQIKLIGNDLFIGRK